MNGVISLDFSKSWAGRMLISSAGLPDGINESVVASSPATKTPGPFEAGFSLITLVSSLLRLMFSPRLWNAGTK